MARIRLENISKNLRPPHRRSRTSTSMSRTASSSSCSAPPAPARPRRCASSPGSKSRPSATSTSTASTSTTGARPSATWRWCSSNIRSIRASPCARTWPSRCKSRVRKMPPGRDRQAHRLRGAHAAHRAPARPQDRPALGRRDAARLDRPRHRARAAGVPDGRAALGPRRQAARGAALRAQGPADAARRHLHLRHPRPGRGHDHGRPHRRAQPGPHRPGRHARRRSTTTRATRSSRASSARPPSTCSPVSVAGNARGDVAEKTFELPLAGTGGGRGRLHLRHPPRGRQRRTPARRSRPASTTSRTTASKRSSPCASATTSSAPPCPPASTSRVEDAVRFGWNADKVMLFDAEDRPQPPPQGGVSHERRGRPSVHPRGWRHTHAFSLAGEGGRRADEGEPRATRVRTLGRTHMAEHTNNYPKLHNAMWPGVVGKGHRRRRADHPARYAAQADRQRRVRRPEVRRRRPLARRSAHLDRQRPPTRSSAGCRPHRQLRAEGRLVRRADLGRRRRRLGHGRRRTTASASSTQVRKACVIGKQMRDLGIRPTGGVRIDSSTGVEALGQGPRGQHQADRRDLPRGRQDRAGPRRVPRRRGRDLLGRHAFLAREREAARDGRHARRRRLPGRHGALDAVRARRQCREGPPPARRITTGRTRPRSTPPTSKVADALRPWTLDFHVAQNDGTTFGSGDHEKTGRHCQVDDPNGRLDVVKHAGYWLRDDKGNLTKTMRHICWDGCMFPNAVMEKQETWNKILGAMVKVRDAHGWRE